MRFRLLAAFALGTTLLLAAPGPAPVLKNEHAIGYEVTLAAGQRESGPAAPSVTVFWADGTGHRRTAAGDIAFTAKRGDVIFRGPGDGPIVADAGGPLHFERVELPQAAEGVRWGAAGLAPHYRLLLENDWARVYDIRIPAGTSERQHTHHDRVVVCLSGAALRHEMPDGRSEDSTLKTGDCLWRKGGTHVGHNLGPTDLWVIAIEPK